VLLEIFPLIAAILASLASSRWQPKRAANSKTNAATDVKKALYSPIIISYCRPQLERTGKLNRISRLSRLMIEETKYNQRMSMAGA
jgi:hypothetical protein